MTNPSGDGENFVFTFVHIDSKHDAIKMKAVRMTNGTVVGFKLLLEHYEEHKLSEKTNQFALLNLDELTIVGEKFIAVDEFSSETKIFSRSPTNET